MFPSSWIELDPLLGGIGILSWLLPLLAGLVWFRKGQDPENDRDEDRGSVRSAVLAGTWYEGDRDGLLRNVDRYLSGAGRPAVSIPGGAERAAKLRQNHRRPRAMIVPHAGHTYSGDCAGAAFRLLEGIDYQRVVLIGPSHHMAIRGLALPEVDAFETPLGTIPLDTKRIEQLRAVPGIECLDAAHAREHSLEIELPFLQKVLGGGFDLVPLVAGRIPEDRLDAVAKAIETIWDPDTLLVISSDFTHYGASFDYLPFVEDAPARLRRLDHGAIDAILERDEDRFVDYKAETGITVCGAEPIRLLLHLPRVQQLEGCLVDYYRSGDKNHDFSHSVSYASIVFFDSGGQSEEDSESETAEQNRGRLLDVREGTFLLEVARQTLRANVSGGAIPRAEEIARNDDRMRPNSPLFEERGVFVTLTSGEDGTLRGCIGNVTAEVPLLEGVIENTIAASTRDPRFPPVVADEEPSIHMEISVLTPLLEVDGPESIQIGRDGVLLEKKGRRAVFLPQVAPEQGWTVDETLQHLCLKAGLAADDWKSDTTLSTFQAQILDEPDTE